MTIDLEIGERILGNGMTVIAIRNKGVRTFAAGVVFDVDMRDEPAQQTGLASLVGDCLDEGSVRRSSIQLAEAADALGAVVHGSSSGGSVAAPAKETSKALRLLREVVSEPVFPAKEVRRVKGEVLQEIAVAEADPRQVAQARFRKEVYGRHPFSRPAYGTTQSVSALKRGDLRRFHATWFVPTGGYVSAAGPAPVEATLDELEKTFRSLRGASPAHVRPQAPAMPKAGIDVHVPMRREQVHVYLGHPGVRRTDPDYYALSVMDHVLGTGPGFTSRIARKLRDEMGLCYAVHAAITTTAGEEPGTFSAYIGTSPEHREKAIAGFREEIDRIRGEKITEKELRDVQEYLTGSYVFGFERNGQLAQYAILAKRFDLGFDHLQRYPDLIRSVTREDVLRVAQAHLRPERMVRVSAGAG